MKFFFHRFTKIRKKWQKKFFKKTSCIPSVLIISKIFKLPSYETRYNIEIQFRIRKMFLENSKFRKISYISLITLHAPWYANWFIKISNLSKNLEDSKFQKVYTRIPYSISQNIQIILLHNLTNVDLRG